MGTNAGLLAGAMAAIPGAGIGLGAATTFGSLADALTKDQSLPEKFATRNIANTYVWTADGGFYSETTDTMDVRQESSSGSYSFNIKNKTKIPLDPTVKTKLEAIANDPTRDDNDQLKKMAQKLTTTGVYHELTPNTVLIEGFYRPPGNFLVATIGSQVNGKTDCSGASSG